MATPPYHTTSNDTSALDYYDKLLKLTLSDKNSSNGTLFDVKVDVNGVISHYVLCQIMSLFPFSSRLSVTEWVASALLAIYHFNNGIDTVIPALRQITGIEGTCDVRFTSEFFDTELSPIIASRIFNDAVRSRRNRSSSKRPIPIAIVGPARSAVAEPLSVLSGLSQIPMLSPTATSTTLDNKGQYPLFGRLIPSSSGDAKASVDYLLSLGVTHASVIYVRDSFGATYREQLQSAARGKMNFSYSSFPWFFDQDKLKSGMKDALQQAANSKYRYFFAVVGSKDYEMFMDIAYDIGIVGPDFVWIFAETIYPSSLFGGKKFKADSPITKATNGIGIISIGISPEILEDRKETHAFMKEYSDLNDDTFKKYLREKKYFVDHDFSIKPTWASILVYDSIITLGIAACHTSAENHSYVIGKELFDRYKEVDFEGVSGRIKIDKATGTRADSTVVYKLTNIVASPPDENGDVTFSIHDTSAYKPTVSSSKRSGSSWVPLFGSRKFTYYDGSEVPPMSLPEKNENMNLIGPGIQALGLTMCCMIIIFSIVCASLTYYYRRHAAIRASQPLFLILICIGTFIMGTTILPLSLEEGGVDTAGLDIACMASWWLYYIGFTTIFATIFSRTWRITKIMCAPQFRRSRVTVTDVIKPLSMLLLANVIILAVWTAWYPVTYERLYLDAYDEFGRSIESYGGCKVDGPSAIFATISLAMNACLLLLVNYQAYKGRHVSSEIMNESMNIAYAVGSTLQAWLLGIPVIVASLTNPPAKFMAICCIIFTTCIATLSFLFVPKIRFLRNDSSVRIPGSMPSSHHTVTSLSIAMGSSGGRPRVVRFE